jgi:hypothetical protein
MAVLTVQEIDPKNIGSVNQHIKPKMRRKLIHTGFLADWMLISF